MECAHPFVDEGEGLGECLADDGTGFVRKEEFGVQRWNRDCQGGAVGFELRIEGLQVIENSLFGFLHLLCWLAVDGDFDKILILHIIYNFNDYENEPK